MTNLLFFAALLTMTPDEKEPEHMTEFMQWARIRRQEVETAEYIKSGTEAYFTGEMRDIPKPEAGPCNSEAACIKKAAAFAMRSPSGEKRMRDLALLAGGTVRRPGSEEVLSLMRAELLKTAPAEKPEAIAMLAIAEAKNGNGTEKLRSTFDRTIAKEKLAPERRARALVKMAYAESLSGRDSARYLEEAEQERAKIRDRKENMRIHLLFSLASAKSEPKIAGSHLESAESIARNPVEEAAIENAKEILMNELLDPMSAPSEGLIDLIVDIAKESERLEKEAHE